MRFRQRRRQRTPPLGSSQRGDDWPATSHSRQDSKVTIGNDGRAIRAFHTAAVDGGRINPHVTSCGVWKTRDISRSVAVSADCRWHGLSVAPAGAAAATTLLRQDAAATRGALASPATTPRQPASWPAGGKVQTLCCSNQLSQAAGILLASWGQPVTKNYHIVHSFACV